MDYAENGGKLVVIGAELCVQMGKLVGYKFELSDESTKYILDESGLFAGIKSKFADLKYNGEKLYFNQDLRDEDISAYRTEKFVKGYICFIPFDFGSAYFEGMSFIAVNYMKRVLSAICTKKVEINRKKIDITLQQDENTLLVNLINLNQSRTDLNEIIYDEVTPVFNINVKIKGSFRNVMMPLGEKFTYGIYEDYVEVELEHLYIHSVIKLEV